jgi:hypothetical protein
MAKQRYISNTRVIMGLLQYKKLVKNNPILVKDWVGKDADQVYKRKKKPLTMEGFENYFTLKEIISDLSHYLCNLDNRYSEYVAICSRIKRNVHQIQIEGMVGFNPSITQKE